MKETFIIARNLSLKKTQCILQLLWVYDSGNFMETSRESKKASKSNQIFDMQL